MKTNKVLVKKLLYSYLCSIFIFFAVFSVFAFYITKNDMEISRISFFSIILISMSAALSGFVSGKITDIKGIISGAVTGGLLSFSLLILLLCTSEFVVCMRLTIIFILIIIFTICGGILSRIIK